MLQNAYFLAKIGADTAENEQHFAKFCQPTLSDVSLTRDDWAAHVYEPAEDTRAELMMEGVRWYRVRG